MPRFNLRYFLLYKALNSAFTGLSVGIFFVLYTPLQPIVYSIGGIVLALGVLLLARFYGSILNATYFYRFSLLVEVVMLVLIAVVLVGGFSLFTAMAVYSGYQLSFMFGSYLLRVESLVLYRPKLLSAIDSAKQVGYMVGLALSYGFYRFYEGDAQAQVYAIHWPMLLLEITIIYTLLVGFGRLGRTAH